MQFVSFYFILFFSLSIHLYQVVPRKARLVVLFISNVVFYASFGMKSLIILGLSTILSYVFHRLLLKRQSKAIFVTSLIVTLLPLLMSKYLTFLLSDFMKLTDKKPGSLFATVGLSFFTFKMLSFLIETYCGKMEAYKVSLFHYAIYVSFFPSITAGPIDRPDKFLSQIQSWTDRRRVSVAELYNSILMILFGYFEKVLIADNLSYVVTYVYNDYNTYGGIFLFAITICYTLQIYFDFAGYSYIARGLARAYGFDSMENFNVPYFSKSIQEFWQRWHISLSSWLKDYVYIPLGGNRKGIVRKYINVMITFAVSGLWHGTGVTYLVWGLLHGLFQVIGALTQKWRNAMIKCLHLPVILVNIWKVSVTFLLVNFAWIFFAAPNKMGSAIGIIKRVFTPTEVWINPFLTNVNMTKLDILVLITALLFCLIVDLMHYQKVDVIALYKKQNFLVKVLILNFLLFGIFIFGMYGPGYNASNFIYFKF